MPPTFYFFANTIIDVVIVVRVDPWISFLHGKGLHGLEYFGRGRGSPLNTIFSVGKGSEAIESSLKNLWKLSFFDVHRLKGQSREDLKK